MTSGVRAITSSRISRSGLKSLARMTIPPLLVRIPAPAPLSATTAISPKSFVGPTATALFTRTSIPSRLSWKSIPSWAGSKTLPVSTLPPESLSITVVGGVRPPAPTTVGAIAAAGPFGVTTASAISVVVRLPVEAPPGRNSATRPLTSTALPIETGDDEPVNAKMPSDVDVLPSPVASWTKTPFDVFAVTTPGTAETRRPSSGDRWPAPWIS